MRRNRLDAAVGSLRALALRRDGGVADGELLERFVRERDQSAFAALVRRLGPMVLGVCRRVLRHEQDAEDAFQAAFLVLVRRAAAVRPPGAVGGWLFGVARRTALEARRAAARRRAHEARATPRTEAPEAPEPDLRAVLDGELAALPDAYRAALVLCDLEGRSRRQAARELGVPEGTVASRLARGRWMLGRRLARRGLPWSAAGLTLALARGASAVPVLLFDSTVEAAGLLAAGRAAALSPRVVALTEGVRKAMGTLKLKAAAAVLLALGVLGAGAAWMSRPSPAAEQPAPRADAAPKPADPPKAAKLKGKRSAHTYLIDEIDLGRCILKVHVQDEEKVTGRTMRYEFDAPAETPILIDGKEGKLADLIVGVPLRLTIDREARARPGTLGAVTRVEAVGATFDGRLEAVDPADMTLRARLVGVGPDAVGMDVADDARIVLDGREAKLSRIKPEMWVNGKLSAVRPVVVELTAYGPSWDAIVEEVDLKKRTISLTNPPQAGAGGGPRGPGPMGAGAPTPGPPTPEVFPVDPDVRIILDGKEAKLSDLEPKMKVTVVQTAIPDSKRIVSIRK
jgi:RNA polymerase sigma factor (sigma-70 family)